MIDGPAYGKLERLEELLESYDNGMEIVFSLLGVKYTTGWNEKGFFIAACPDGDGIYFKEPREMLEHFKIDGKPIGEMWRAFEIEMM